MTFRQELARCIRQRLTWRKNFEEKKRLSGVGFLLNGNLLVGASKDSVLVRLRPAQGDKALKEAHASEFQITGRGKMKGWRLVAPEGVEDVEELTAGIGRATRFVGTLSAKEK